MSYALLGVLLGAVSVAVPLIGGVLFFAGPTLGAVYAVMTSPVEAFTEPGRAQLHPASGSPLWSFTF